MTVLERTRPLRSLLAHLPAPGAWTAHARCRTAPPELFFPAKTDSLDAARNICAHCPVRDACRAYAIAAGPALKGVWGGLSERERDRARRGE